MPNEPYAYIRCLFCVSGCENAVVRRISAGDLGFALQPMKTMPLFRNGQWADVQKPLLPGYVFVYANEPTPVSALSRTQDVLRVLTYGKDDVDGYLNEHDRGIAEWFLRENGVVGNLDAIAEGDYIRITDGLLRDFDGRVLRVNKRKRLANVELNVMGGTQTIWLGFQLLTK